MADTIETRALSSRSTYVATDVIALEVPANDTDRKMNLKDLRNITNGLFVGNETVQAEAATTTFVAADFDLIITNTGASGAVVYTLPAASAVKGRTMRVAVTAAQQVSLDPVATDAVFLNGSGVDNKDLVIAGTIGHYVDLYSNGTNFLVVGYSGVITKEG